MTGATYVEMNASSAMPHYHFHVRTSAGLIDDSEGMELPNTDAVRREVIQAARELMAQAILEGHDISGHAFRVETEDGSLVLDVPFRSTFAAAEG
jgi:hypothetical protein